MKYTVRTGDGGVKLLYRYSEPKGPPNNAELEFWQVLQWHRRALEAAEEAMVNSATTCTHDDKDENYRPLGDTYGWCSACGTKVNHKENDLQDAITLVRKILKEYAPTDSTSVKK